MALLPTNKSNVKKAQDSSERKNNPNIRPSDIKITDDTKVTYGDKVYKASERQSIRVDPPVLKMISNLSYAKDIPMYKMVEVAMNAYLETLSESERRIYDAKQSKIG